MAVQLAHVDEATPYRTQLAARTGPIVLVNTFIAPEGKMDEVLAAWKLDSEYFKSKPGFISAQLHRGTAGSNALVNIAVWESTQQLAAAFATPEFQEHMKRYPDGTVASPHVYEKVAVEGICIA